jgi:hypothetical protein
MELQELEQALEQAFSTLDHAGTDVFLRSDAVIEAKEELAILKAGALVEDVFKGSNEKLREAQAALYFRDRMEQISELEANERSSKAHLALAQSAVDLLRYRLRIAEMANRA